MLFAIFQLSQRLYLEMANLHFFLPKKMKTCKIFSKIAEIFCFSSFAVLFYPFCKYFSNNFQLIFKYFSNKCQIIFKYFSNIFRIIFKYLSDIFQKFWKFPSVLCTFPAFPEVVPGKLQTCNFFAKNGKCKINSKIEENVCFSNFAVDSTRFANIFQIYFKYFSKNFQFFCVFKMQNETVTQKQCKPKFQKRCKNNSKTKNKLSPMPPRDALL